MNSRSFYITLTAVSVGALAMSLLLMPQAEHIPLMLLDDGQYEGALDKYQDRIRDGDLDPSVVVPIVRVLQAHARDGDAIELMEDYTHSHPDSIEARIFLTELYEESKRYHAHLSSMQALSKLQPSAKLFREIRDVSELLGVHDTEREALHTLVAMGEANQDESRRLAYFLAQYKDYEGALDLLQPFIHREKFSELKVDTLEFAVHMLGQLGREEELDALVDRYLMTISETKQIEGLLSVLVDDRFYELVIRILDRPAWRNRYDSSLVRTRVDALEFTGKSEELVAYVHQLDNDGHLPISLQAAALTMALDKEDREWVESQLARFELEEIEQNDLESLLGWILTRRDKGLAQQIADGTDPDFLKEFPAVEFGLKAILEDLSEQQARVLWKELEATKKLADDDRVAIAGFSAARDYTALVHEIAASVQDPDDLTAEDFYEYIALLVVLDEDQRAIAAVADIQPWGDDEPDAVEAAWALAYLAAGGADTVADWMEQEPRIDPFVLRDLFEIASEEEGAEEVALLSSERLLKQRPSPLHEAFYAHAQVLSGETEEGMTVLRELKHTEPGITVAYFEALADAAERNPKYTAELHDAVAEEIETPTLNLARMKEVAFALLENGFPREAEPILRKASKDAPFESAVMQSLLYSWESKLNDDQREWVYSRVLEAPADERAGWFKYLVEVQEPEMALELVREEDLAHDDVLEGYILVLLTLKRKDEVSAYIERFMEQVDDTKRLKGLAQEALWAGAYDISSVLYLRVLELDPDDTSIYKQLGSIAFSQGAYSEAYDYLMTSLECVGPDYLVYHMLADIFYLQYDDGIARIFYSNALYELTCLPEKKPEDMAIEAHTLLRLKCYEEAEALYCKLIHEHPKALNYRADYANLLVELEEYCAAEGVLGEAYAVAEAEGVDDVGTSDRYAQLTSSYIQLLQRTERQKEAWAVAHYSLCQRPNDPLFYHSAADVDLYIGQWCHSLRHLAEASCLAPKDEALAKLRYRIAHKVGPFASLAGEYRKTGLTQTDFFVRYHQENYCAPFVRALFDIESDCNKTDPLASYPSGVNRAFDATRYRARMALRREFSTGTFAEGSLMWARQVVGAAALVQIPDYYGETRFFGHINEPNWDLVASVAQNGARDRYGVSRTLRLLPRLQVSGGAAYNRYYLDVDDWMGRTYSLQGAVSYTLSPLHPIIQCLGRRGMVRLDYLFDLERVRAQRLIPIATGGVPQESDSGNLINPLGLSNRELHTTALFIGQRLHTLFAWEGSAGYSYDRVGSGGGPVGGVGFVIGREECLHGILNFSHTVSTQGTASTADSFLFKLHYPF